MQDEAERRNLYDQGLNDGAIAAKLGLHYTTIRSWRRSRGLPSKHWGKGLEGPRRPPTQTRRFLHQLGWGRKAIARHEGVSYETIREWCRHQNLMPQSCSVGLSRADRHEQLRALQKRIIKAIGTRLPFDIAADAAASLMLAVIEGEVQIDEIEKHARRFGNQALNQYANSFRQRSLDEDTPGSEGLRHIDMLVDESSSGWLEEMGATVH
tara:strand:- start:1798 stop:2427 length:630 start_codon:yes stop_codon:yes gene_type:complete